MALVWLGEHSYLDREVVGGKALSLNHMHVLGLPVPPAFVLTTDECARYLEHNRLAPDLMARLGEAVAELEERTGRRFGGQVRPLLVSVRSGAARSMPGMMDTVLNLGVNGDVEAALLASTGDARYAADTHQRFRAQFERVVGRRPPADPWEQLVAAVGAVFASWRSKRASSYRRHHGIPDDGGTSVTVQAMVFGNLDPNSGTGVLFSRDPLTGERAPYGEWLPYGQGEDVVSGSHDPQPLSRLGIQQPIVHAQLLEAARVLEATGRDVQDIEFTVEAGRLWLLQSRPAKRSPDAAVRLAVAMRDEGILDVGEALRRVTPAQVAAVCRPRVEPRARALATVLARGEPACPGVAAGRVALDVDSAEALADEGVDVVLARQTTDPNDVPGMIVAAAVVTEIGGVTSHAAVVSRELGTPCVVGCGDGTVTALGGQDVTVDGTAGEVLAGRLTLTSGNLADNPALTRLLAWARERVPDHQGAPAELLSAAQQAG